ncbi:DUF2314 domain-containing protein [Lysobacter sp. FW306-1B-D06B]|uniref:DUF2314 domain-containing protein n=1 Tax=Lysobacter sp. FW306-1B-D06B TaxID=3140250 RepID=UPI0031406170
MRQEYDGYPVRAGFCGPGWELEDCAAIARRHRQTFEVPSAAALSGLKVGDLARLHFVITAPDVVADRRNPRAERMWVEVCKIHDDSSIWGHLTNEPALIESLAPGDVVEFAHRHVAQVLPVPPVD